LIVILAPLLLMLLVGISYDSFVGYGLTIGVSAESFGGEIKDFEQRIADMDYNVVEYATIDKCVKDAKLDLVHACVDLPGNFVVDDNSAKSVTIYVDQSRVNLVGTVQGMLEEQFNLKSAEISEALLDDLLSNVFDVKSGISDQHVTLSSVYGTSEKVSSSLSSSSSEISSDENSKVLGVFEEYVSSKLSSSQTYVADVKTAVSAVENISSAEKDEIEALLVSLEDQITNAQVQISSNEKYSFTAIEKIVSDLENSLVSVQRANDNLADTFGEFDAALSALESYSASLEGLEVTEASTLHTPLVTNVEMLSSSDSKFNYLFPSILVLVAMFLSVMLANTLVMMEKKSPAYIRNVLLPISKAKFVLANFLSCVILVAVQMAILLVVSLLFIQDVSIVSFPVMFLAVLCGICVFTLIGMLIGSVFSSEQTSVLAAISTGSLFLFLSGVIVPIEGMAPELRGLIEYNPYVLLEGVIRSEFIFGNSIMSYFEPLSVLLLYSGILFVGILLYDILLHKNLVHKALYRYHKKARKKQGAHEEKKR